jgi:outer membrane protein TolC
LTRRPRLPRFLTIETARVAAVVVVCLAGHRAAGRDISLPEAQERVRSAHEALKAAGHELRERRAEVGAADALRWPKLEASARVTRIDDPITFDLDPIRKVILSLHPAVPAALVPPFTLEVQDDLYERADVRLTWPLFAGGRIDAARDAARAREADAGAQLRAVGDALATEVVRRYYAARLAERARAIRAEVLSALDGHLRNARRLEEEGLLSRAERLHAEVARTEAERELKAAGHDLALAREALANVLSLPAEDADGLVTTTPLFVPAKLPPLPELKAAARDANPALARLEAAASLASAGLAAEKGRWYPEVALFGVRELYEPGLTLLDPTWAAGLSARLTLFDGFSREKGIAAARERGDRVAELAARARRDVETLVEKRYREASKAREQVEAFGAALELARENVRVRTRAFEEGVATSLDVVDARLSLAKVELGRLAAARDLDVALAELLEAAGQTESYEALRADGAGDVEK